MQLERFLQAQDSHYAIALEEVRHGKKQSHWMWYVFPQLKGLGHSSIAAYYGLQGRAEAEAYFSHPILGHRLREITRALLQLPFSDAHTIFGSPDDMKLRSCMTLFFAVSEDILFARVLDKFYGGKPDPLTLRLLQAEAMAPLRPNDAT